MGAPFLDYPAWLMAIFVLVLILVFIWIGMWFKKYEIRRGKEKFSDGLGSVENSMLTLLGLILAFTFGMALNKFENRRSNIINESNAIGTAILRCDLFPDSIRLALRSEFRQYVEARINYYTAGTDTAKIRIAVEDAAKNSSSIWRMVASLPPNPENFVRTNLMVPAVNEVIDIVTTRDAERVAKIPPLLLLTLLTLTLMASFLVGYDQLSAKRSQVFIFGFALMTTVVLYLILELDRPRSGLINLNSAQKYVVELRGMF